MNYDKQKYLLLNNIPKSILGKMLDYNVIIAGGAIRSVFAGEYISDYDLYFTNEKDLIDTQKYLHFLDNSELMFTTENAKTYKIDKLLFQVILLPSLILPTAEDIIKHFDFTICMGAYDINIGAFILHPRFLLDIARRDLVFNVEAKYPLASLYRIKKYIERGYKISGTEIIKIGLAINNLKMGDYTDLKEQLMGIDTLFLKELTDKLMTPEYAEKKYDLNDFLEMIEQHYSLQIEELFDGI